MLEHLIRRIERTIASTPTAILSTCGLLGMQAGLFACEYNHPYLYLLVPSAMDILDNLQDQPQVLVTAEGWQVRGRAALVSQMHMDVLDLSRRSDLLWNQAVQITPERIHLRPINGWVFEETIDFDC